MGIKIHNLETGKIAEEKVCAEAFMRFLYANPCGAPLLFSVFKRAFFSRLCGIWADSKISAASVSKFVRDNNIDASEFLRGIESYKTFNEFFTRAIVPESRPLAESDNPRVVSFPSDGRHLLIENVSRESVFYVKGGVFNLGKFLGDTSLARRFENGSMLISRLSPLDYHRFHWPISGEVAARRKIGGHLYSVSPIAFAEKLSIFWENRRVLTIVDSPIFGMCAFVEIGATNVGTIVNFSKIGDTVNRGDEAGMFRFGGSCVATIFPASAKIEWREKLIEMSRAGVECYAKVNTLAGVLK